MSYTTVGTSGSGKAPGPQVQAPGPGSKELPKATIPAKKDSAHPMHALTWHGKKDVRVEQVPKPMITDPQDVILRVTSACICGSDLHLYVGAMPGMKKGDILGHEFMGIVEEVGPEVRAIKKGDRVVACFDIGCGLCKPCQRKDFSCCDTTNPSKEQEKLYGARTGGYYGYSHLTGGWEGGQADYVRVPFADINLMKLPSDLPDERVILLSDVLPTAWWANECAEVKQGDTVAVWGAGPVGILAAHCAFVRGASKVMLIDDVEYRLDHAKFKMPHLITINFAKEKVKDELEKVVPGGPDCCIEAVGFHYVHSIVHKLETNLMLETDPSEIVNELIYCCRKAGRIALIGVYAGYANHFNLGALMEKALTIRGGQTPVQRFWPDLLAKVRSGELDPTMVLTHRLPLDKAPHGYKVFNDKEDGCIKVVLKPAAEMARMAATQEPAEA